MDHKEPAPSYETALEGVGAYLDAQCATEFKLLETPDGYAVTFKVQASDPESSHAFFKFSDLHRPAVDLGLVRKIRRPLGLEDRKYRHLLEAIGHDLDSSRAMCILMDELPESLLITYEYDDPQRGYLLRKRMALAGPRDRERLAREAHHRRLRLRPHPAPKWQPTTDVNGFR